MIFVHFNSRLSSSCEIDNHCIVCRLNASYVRSFLGDNDVFDGVGFANESIQEPISGCTFTEEGDEFVYRTDGSTLMDCPVTVRWAVVMEGDDATLMGGGGRRMMPHSWVVVGGG